MTPTFEERQILLKVETTFERYLYQTGQILDSGITTPEMLERLKAFCPRCKWTGVGECVEINGIAVRSDVRCSPNTILFEKKGVIVMELDITKEMTP